MRKTVTKLWIRLTNVFIFFFINDISKKLSWLKAKIGILNQSVKSCVKSVVGPLSSAMIRPFWIAGSIGLHWGSASIQNTLLPTRQQHLPLNLFITPCSSFLCSSSKEQLSYLCLVQDTCSHELVLPGYSSQKVYTLYTYFFFSHVSHAKYNFPFSFSFSFLSATLFFF